MTALTIMPKPFKVQVTVKAVTRSPCPNFKVGDTWIVQQGITPDGMCSRVYYSVTFAMQTMAAMGPNIPESERNITEICCPDTRHLLIYEVKRIDSSEDNLEK